MANSSRFLTSQPATEVDYGAAASGNAPSELESTRSALISEMQRSTRLEQLCQELRRRSLKVREDEQRRIARELHDQVGQTLTVLRLAITAGRRAIMQSEVVAARLADAEQACAELERGLAEVRERLRPAALDELGLYAAVEQLVAKWMHQHEVEAELLSSALPQSLPEEVETTSYRLVQEALTNIARHAHAHHVTIVLQGTPTHLVVSVEDDGVGFDVGIAHPGHFGLIGMRERLALCEGTLEISSERGAGTHIVARLPLLPDQPEPVSRER